MHTEEYAPNNPKVAPMPRVDGDLGPCTRDEVTIRAGLEVYERKNFLPSPPREPLVAVRFDVGRHVCCAPIADKRNGLLISSGERRKRICERTPSTLICPWSLSLRPAKMKHLVFASLAFLTLIAVAAVIRGIELTARVLSVGNRVSPR